MKGSRGKYEFYHLLFRTFLQAKARVLDTHDPVLDMIAKGEGDKQEFKETLAADATTGVLRKELHMATLKTIAGFLKADGGTLFIGVSDKGEIKGLEKDFKLCKNKNRDGFQSKLRALIHEHLDPKPMGLCSIRFVQLAQGTVCRVKVKRALEVTHLDGEVHVREGNETRKLGGRDRTRWIEERKRKPEA